MSVSCILQGQNNSGIKLENQKFIQEFEDVTEEVKSAVGVDVLEENIDEHIVDKSNPHEVTTEQIGAAKESEVGSLYLWEKSDSEGNIEYITSNNKSAYPEDGEQDGYKYTFKGQIGDKLSNNSGMKYVFKLPEIPVSPIDIDEEIPYSWEEINAIALSGHAEDWISVGAIKSITLSKAILGTTIHDVRVIGINQDNNQSITFQTKDCLAEPTYYFDSSIDKGISQADLVCSNYQDAFIEGNKYIKTVKKGVASVSFLATYNDQAVWIPSESEMGLDAAESYLSYSNSVEFNGECTKGYKFQYQYYNSNERRIKETGENGWKAYWTRSNNASGSDDDNNGGRRVIHTSTGLSGPAAAKDQNIYFAPAFVIGQTDNIIVQDDKDITKYVLNDKIGDIRFSVNQNFNIFWALCNGEELDEDNELAKSLYKDSNKNYIWGEFSTNSSNLAYLNNQYILYYYSDVVIYYTNSINTPFKKLSLDMDTSDLTKFYLHDFTYIHGYYIMLFNVTKTSGKYNYRLYYAKDLTASWGYIDLFTDNRSTSYTYYNLLPYKTGYVFISHYLSSTSNYMYTSPYLYYTLETDLSQITSSSFSKKTISNNEFYQGSNVKSVFHQLKNGKYIIFGGQNCAIFDDLENDDNIKIITISDSSIVALQSCVHENSIGVLYITKDSTDYSICEITVDDNGDITYDLTVNDATLNIAKTLYSTSITNEQTFFYWNNKYFYDPNLTSSYKAELYDHENNLIIDHNVSLTLSDPQYASGKKIVAVVNDKNQLVYQIWNENKSSFFASGSFLPYYDDGTAYGFIKIKE